VTRLLPEVLARFMRTAPFQDPAVARRARTLLGAEERAAFTRLRSLTARRDYLAAHALARATLAEVAGCAVWQLRFRASSLGRPAVVAPRTARRLYFSLSHADGVALCAVAPGLPVGADVETACNIGPDPLSVADHACSSEEQDALRALPPADRARRLVFLWTMKEAVAKGIGLGFYLPLNRITAMGRDSPWRLQSRRLTPDHLATVAVRTRADENVAVRFEEVEVA